MNQETIWIDSAINMPEMIDHGFELFSRLVLVRGDDGCNLAYLASPFVEDPTEEDPHWRVKGQDGYRLELQEVDSWCEIPA